MDHNNEEEIVIVEAYEGHNRALKSGIPGIPKGNSRRIGDKEIQWSDDDHFVCC